MNNLTKIKPPVWFWIISIVALLWNLAGVFAYLATAYMKDEMMAEYTEAQKELLNGQPSWVMGAFAIAVFGGALGCIALLLRKKWAKPLLMLSLLAVLTRTVYFFFMTNGTEVFSVGEGTVMPILTVIISALLVIFARIASDRKWIS